MAIGGKSNDINDTRSLPKIGVGLSLIAAGKGVTSPSFARKLQVKAIHALNKDSDKRLQLWKHENIGKTEGYLNRLRTKFKAPLKDSFRTIVHASDSFGKNGYATISGKIDPTFMIRPSHIYLSEKNTTTFLHELGHAFQYADNSKIKNVKEHIERLQDDVLVDQKFAAKLHQKRNEFIEKSFFSPKVAKLKTHLLKNKAVDTLIYHAQKRVKPALAVAHEAVQLGYEADAWKRAYKLAGRASLKKVVAKSSLLPLVTYAVGGKYQPLLKLAGAGIAATGAALAFHGMKKGEGSRGGKIIGHSKRTQKAIYASSYKKGRF